MTFAARDEQVVWPSFILNIAGDLANAPRRSQLSRGLSGWLPGSHVAPYISTLAQKPADRPISASENNFLGGRSIRNDGKIVHSIEVALATNSGHDRDKFGMACGAFFRCARRAG